MIPNDSTQNSNINYVHSTTLDSADGDKRKFCLRNFKETVWGDSRHSLPVERSFLSWAYVTRSLVKFHVALFPKQAITVISKKKKSFLKNILYFFYCTF